MKQTFIKLITVFLLLFPAISAATVVRLETTLGVIDIQLYDTEAPLTVENFLSYVEGDAYNHSFIHRSVPDFVVQGGGVCLGCWNECAQIDRNIAAGDE